MRKLTLSLRCTAGCLILLSAYTVASAQAVSDRLVIQLPAAQDAPPVELIAVRAQEGIVQPDQYFSASDEWLRGLTFTLRNVSNHPLLWAGVELSFRDAVNPLVRRVLYRLQHNGRSGGASAVQVQPGESFDVSVTDEDSRNLERLLQRAGLTVGVHRLEFRLEGAVAE